ncbi:hypothetical protein D2E70_08775 [Mycobacteroides abscessus]|nr:hypothetical protein D2E70_08775 [Mycobacteroides abscessus]
MWLTVVTTQNRRFTTDYDTVSTFIEDLRDGGLQVATTTGLVKGHADKAGGKIAAVALHAPRHTAGFVVQRYVEIPGSRGLVLAARTLWRRG